MLIVMLIIICIMAMQALIMTIKAIQSSPYIQVRVVGSLLLILSSLRYITLLLFAKAPSVGSMNKMEGFYYITIISIPILLILVIWHITPLYREKVGLIGLGLLSAPHTILYIAMLILRPFRAVKSQIAGYNLRYTGSWGLYVGLTQIIFILIYIIFAVYGFRLYKHKQTRGQYLVLIMCLVLLLVDGVSYAGLGMQVIPAFTLTEVFCFLAIYFGFSKPTIDYRAKRLSSRQ